MNQPKANSSWNEWTLFLDRDGVINRELPADYVKRIDEFEFEPEALEAIRLLSGVFKRLIIVTNQRGVGAGLMTKSDLDAIHAHMTEQVSAVGGRIDAIYSATAMDRQSHERKPNPTLALRAQADFPDINFSKTLMVGNSESDIRFGQNLGMKTAFIDDKGAYRKMASAFESDMLAPSLHALAIALIS
jgi:D-glycero-D-manno-heptose 1,7-bisphosphate phosphatase/D-glycero-alpha-D-manno-heptose 1-phosphate guanylyltransferase